MLCTEKYKNWRRSYKSNRLKSQATVSVLYKKRLAIIEYHTQILGRFSTEKGGRKNTSLAQTGITKLRTLASPLLPILTHPPHHHIKEGIPSQGVKIHCLAFLHLLSYKITGWASPCMGGFCSPKKCCTEDGIQHLCFTPL